MKKKILAVLTTTALVLALLTLCGCGNLLGDLFNIEGEEGEKETLSSKEEVEDALGGNYEIVVKFGIYSSESGSAPTYTQKNTVKVADGYTFYSNVDLPEDDASPVVYLSGDGILYSYDDESEKYTSGVALNEDNEVIGAYGFVLAFVGTEIEYNTKTTETFIGRSCTKYSREFTMTVAGSSINTSVCYYIDNQTGICLKYSLSGDVSTAAASSSSSNIAFEAESFTLGQTDLDGEIAKIAVVEWPSAAQFDSFGLDNVANPEGNFFSGNVTIEESNISSISICFTIDNLDDVCDLCADLYDAGAKYDESGNLIPTADLPSPSDSIIAFQGYTIDNNSAGLSATENGNNYLVTIKFIMSDIT